MSVSKMGFWAVASLVVGCQVGSGVFTLPSSLAIYGPISIFGWLISGTGAILLALIFSYLCMKMPKAGGPHVYVEAAFGKDASFFTAWTYWLISWVSSIVVLIAAVTFINHIIGDNGPVFNLILEIFILLIITLINIKGVSFAGRIELILTIFKCLPLIIIPIGGLMMINLDNFTPLNPSNYSDFEAINKVSLFTLWGFVGLESATATAGSIKNPGKTIPRAVVLGTVFVAIIYMLNSIGIMAIIPYHQLASENAPYVRAAQILFGGKWDILIAVISCVACLGTLNAWVLTSGQIAYGAAKDKLLPKIFGNVNKNNSPYLSIILSFLGTVPILFITLDKNLISQVNAVLDFSVTAFLFIYLVCMLSFLKLKMGNKKQVMVCILAIIFCLWVLHSVSLLNLAISLLFVLSGIPIYIWCKRRKNEYFQ